MEQNISLKKYSTFGIGGRSRFFISVTSVAELTGAISEAKERNWSWRLVGGGANTLFADQDYQGLTIHMAIKGLESHDKEDETVVKAYAGEDWDKLVKWSTDRGYFGLENLSGIPGSVGAAPVQNIGSYGVELQDVLAEVEALNTETGVVESFSPEQCRLGYRHSFFKEPAGEKYLVVSVSLLLRKKGKPVTHYRDVEERVKDIEPDELTPERIRELILDIRNSKFPDLGLVGSAGSFFTNPVVSTDHYRRLVEQYPELPGHELEGGDRVKLSTAWILDRVCGLKGWGKGKVRLYEKQPLVVVAEPGASAMEVKELADEVQEQVREKTGIELRWEVTFM